MAARLFFGDVLTSQDVIHYQSVYGMFSDDGRVIHTDVGSFVQTFPSEEARLQLVAAKQAIEAISPAQLEAIQMVEQGVSIAEAQMTAYGLAPDDFVFTDSDGNFAAAHVINDDGILVADGADATDGLVIIDPVLEGLPNFALPARPGMDPYDATDTIIFGAWDEPPIQTPYAYSLEFDVDAGLSGQAGLADFEAALAERPTPGDSQGSSVNGTINDVGPLDQFTPDWLIDNLVYSFRIDNPEEDQTDYFINYTQSDQHQAADGIVLQYGELEDDGSITHHIYGEGDSFLQNTGVEVFDQFVADRTYDVWEQLSADVTMDALDM